MRTGWERATKIMAVVALAATSALAIGCGPAPGYEPEPRVPVGYTPVGDTSVEQYPQPVSSEELQARANAQQDPNSAENVQAAPGDIVVGADPTQYSDTDPSALTEFKPALDGHGQWVDDSTYGTVWVPSEAEVGTDFVPYSTAGHWTYADDTNYVWVSDYSWGWAPFHYGRWAHVGHHGWVWIPGRTYAGAWVDWRYGSGYDYVGWAPLGPSWYWSNGYAVGWGFGYSPYYTYCHRDYLYDPYVGRHSVYGNDPRAREHESHTRPYVAAAPSVGAGGGRVAATPTVGPGGGRIAATPTVGPRPSEIGVAPKMVVAPPRDNAGLARAREFASPATAVAHGAAPPATSPVRRRIDHDAVIASPSPRPSFDNRGPVTSNRLDSTARAPQVQGVQPSAPRPSSAAPSAFDNRASAPRAFSSSSNPAATAPSYRPAPGAQTQAMPQYRSTPVPTYRPSPSPGISQSAPTYRAAPSFSQPAQSYHPSAPAMRSAPTYSAPHVSAPSAPASRPSAPRSSGSRGHR